MRILVADTSVLIDLERADLLKQAFSGTLQFAVPDVLYQRELVNNIGPGLVKLGMQVLELDPAATETAQSTHQNNPAISVSDAFALTLAVARDWPLLAGDGALRSLAGRSKMECHGILWLMDQMLALDMAAKSELHAGLKTLSEHRRCRLPVKDVQAALARYSPG